MRRKVENRQENTGKKQLLHTAPWILTHLVHGNML